MSKKKRKKKKKQDTKPTELTGEHYCEYVCTNGDWYLVGANLSGNEYCPPYNPDHPELLGGFTEGQLERIYPYEYATHLMESPPAEPNPDSGPSYYFSKYEYNKKRKCFILTHANCPKGHYAPRVLSLKYVKQNGFVTFPIPIPNLPAPKG